MVLQDVDCAADGILIVMQLLRSIVAVQLLINAFNNLQYLLVIITRQQLINNNNQ